MANRTTRRRFFGEITAVSAGLTVLTGTRGQSAPKVVVSEIKVISRQPGVYHGWPTLARTRDGKLLVAYSGNREAHVCPFGQVQLMVSNDDGATWSWPQVVLDSPIDDRDAGVLETSRGTIIVTTFTSLAYERILAKAEALSGPGAWTHDRLSAWRSAHDRLSAERRKEELGQWLVRSTDGGASWSQRYDTRVNSPHGPVQLSDGRLLYAGKELWQPGERAGVCESKDDGISWQWLADIPLRPGDEYRFYHELHAVEAADGRLIVHIRNHSPANEGETLQCHSLDGGKTWSTPETIGVWGLPSFLLRLQSGRLLMTYGYRRTPFGIQARTSENAGGSWSEPLVLSVDGASGDLGYPSTVELEDGTLLTVWYELLSGSPRAILRQARWRIEE